MDQIVVDAVLGLCGSRDMQTYDIAGLVQLLCAVQRLDVSGDHCLIGAACTVGHDAVLEKYVTLYPGVNVSGNTHLREQCEMGTGSQIIQGLSVGERTIVGAGATVVRDLPPDCTAVGVPARPIK